MDKNLFESLLFESESEILDFKEKQYPFSSNDEKSELLKDVLGIANAWRRATAYIIIGVREVAAGQAEVVGISESDHLKDNNLQQFVNSKTNQPLKFRYETYLHGEKHVGIIVIDEQDRPIYLKANFGKLKAESVYVRRGSSTDPTRPAKPDEVAKMGHPIHPVAELRVEFADENKKALGQVLHLAAENCEMPADGSIEDLVMDHPMFSMDKTNESFYRDMAYYEKVKRIIRPVQFAVTNIGRVVAKNVRIEMTTPDDDKVVAGSESDLPAKPRASRNLMEIGVEAAANLSLGVGEGSIEIRKSGKHYRLSVDFGDLQPGRGVHSDVWYIGRASSGEIRLAGNVLAENVPNPIPLNLTIKFTVKNTHMTSDEVYKLGEEE